MHPLLPALFILACSSASAQTDNERTLAPVVVTASRIEQSQTDALPHTTVIGPEEIRNSQAVDLPSLLKHEAGIQFTQNGGYGEASGLFLRGAQTRQTLVLIDGVPMTKQDATGTVSIEHLMLDQIDHIEVVRGNVSSIYGSSAVGGVIQIFTKRGEGPPQASVSAEAGSRDTNRVSAGISGSSEGLHYSLSASNFHTGGFSALNPAQIPSANPDHDGYRNTSASGTISQEWAKGQEFGLRFLGTRGKADFDQNFGAPEDVQTSKTDLGMFSLFARNRLAANWSSQLSYSEFRDKNENRYESAFGVTEDSFRTRTRALQWNNEIALNAAWAVIAGVERQWQMLDSDDGYGTVFDVNRNADSVYAGLQGKSGAHQWQFNVRHDQLDRVDSATTGYLGYGYSLTEALKATASVSTGFSAPPLGYLYAPGFGNPDLKPEHARSVETGLQYALQDVLLRAVVFATRTRDELQYDPVSNRFENIARTRNKGLELSASGKWFDTSLRGSLTLQDPRDDVTDERLRRRARTLASVSASRAIQRWEIGGNVDYSGSRPDGASWLGAYWVANLNARYAVSKAFSVFGRIENLFDRDYQTAYGYNQPPRGVFVGVNWKS